MVAGILGQLFYNGSKILEALKGQAFKLGIATILRAFCCGIAAFILKEKYKMAMMTSTQDRNRRSAQGDEEEPMEVDQDLGGAQGTLHSPLPGLGKGIFASSAGGAAKEGRNYAKF